LTIATSIFTVLSQVACCILLKDGESDMRNLTLRTLSVIRTLTAAWYLSGAAVLFAIGVWIAWPIGNFNWIADIIAVLFGLSGMQWVRRACEEIASNPHRRPLEGQQFPNPGMPPSPERSVGMNAGRVSRLPRGRRLYE
jgi:hypothetical protein